MKGFKVAAVSLLATVALGVGGEESFAKDGCEGGANHTIQVSAGPDGAPELRYRGGSAEEVHVCIGDTVNWVLNGPDRTFLVDFYSSAPFAGDAKVWSSGNKIQVVIGGPAARGESYAYDVAFDGGGSLDPHIIVDE